MKSATAAAINKRSQFGNCWSQASPSSSALTTFMTLTSLDVGIDELAQIMVTSAPREAAALARAAPIRPDERLPMNLTGSIASLVPPAVTKTLTPRKSDLPPAESSSAKSSRGSINLPLPASPWDASCPSPGSRTVIPRSLSVATFATVAGFSHIRLFIAGATRTLQLAARTAAETSSSLLPAATREIKFAVAGATTKTSAFSTRAR